MQTLEKRKHFAGLKRGRGGVPEQAKKAQKSAHSQKSGRERKIVLFQPSEPLDYSAKYAPELYPNILIV